MAAYMVITAEIEDEIQFMKYAKAAAMLVEEFGGTYIVRGGKTLTLENNWPKTENDTEKTVISRWPSPEAALSFWNSPQYAKIKTLRIGTAKVRVKIFEGCDVK